MRNIETFPSKQMYLYLSLVERKVAEFYHNIDRRLYLVWLKWPIFIAFSGQLMVSLAMSNIKFSLTFELIEYKSTKPIGRMPETVFLPIHSHKSSNSDDRYNTGLQSNIVTDHSMEKNHQQELWFQWSQMMLTVINKSVRVEGAGQENELRVMKPFSGAHILLTFTYCLSALLTKC